MAKKVLLGSMSGLVRDLFTALLRVHELEYLGCFDSYGELLEAAYTHKADIVILVIRHPKAARGIADNLRKQCPNLKVIVFRDDGRAKASPLGVSDLMALFAAPD